MNFISFSATFSHMLPAGGLPQEAVGLPWGPFTIAQGAPPTPGAGLEVGPVPLGGLSSVSSGMQSP